MNSNLLAVSYTDYLFTKPSSPNVPTHKVNNSISFLKKKYPHHYPMQKTEIHSMINDHYENINISVLLEFYRIEGDFEELSKAISLLNESNNESDRAWAELYMLLLQFYKHELKPSLMINKVMKIQTYTNEMIIFSLIIHLTGLMRENMHGPVEKLSKHIFLLIDEVENDYLRNSYRLQMLQFHSASRLLLNKIDECRERCLEIENMKLFELYPFCYCNIYHILAQSYQFTDYEQAIYWLDKAHHHLLTLTTEWVPDRIKNIQNTRYFIENYWRKNIDYNPDDLAETAHRHIVRGENEEAIIILDKLYQENGYFSPFQEYYYAIATKNPRRIQIAKEKFSWNSNQLFYHLFKKEKLKLYNLFEDI